MTRLAPLRGSPILRSALDIHAAPGLIVDICCNRGSMWRDLPYQPLRCDIDASLPGLDVISDWKDLPRFIGPGRAVTVVADPLFVSHAGKKSVWRRYASEQNEFDDIDVMGQVADILAAARAMLHADLGTLILKLGDQVHGGAQQFQAFKTLKLAEELGWMLCDQRTVDGARMPDPKRLRELHWPSQVHWLVLHSGAQCPGRGLAMPGRTRCAYCGRVVAVERVRKQTYCRPPRGCRAAAYRKRKQR